MEVELSKVAASMICASLMHVNVFKFSTAKPKSHNSISMLANATISGNKIRFKHVLV